MDLFNSFVKKESYTVFTLCLEYNRETYKRIHKQRINHVTLITKSKMYIYIYIEG